jgi:hypothetical protein
VGLLFGLLDLYGEGGGAEPATVHLEVEALVEGWRR